MSVHSTSSGSANMKDDVESGPAVQRQDSSHASDTNKVEDGPGAEADDPFSVWWEGDQDPENPQNWTDAKKWGIIATLSFITFLTSVEM
jgi:hypothetical protein